MTTALWLFDLLLGGSIVGLAILITASRDLFKSVVLFIVFGVLMSLAWIRLRAPDIALAEAAIGAGLTGVLLLNIIRSVGKSGEEQHIKQWPKPSRIGEKTSILLAALLISMIGLHLMTVVTSSAMGNGGLGSRVRASLAESGVTSEVTAVLLNFRGYDTLLEIAVLLLALLGVSSLRLSWALPVSSRPHKDPIVTALSRVLVPAAVVGTGYLLWSGSHAPGGAFQAGALLAAGGVLLHLAGYSVPVLLRGPLLRVLLLAGFLVFLLVAGGTMLSGNVFLEYPSGRADSLIVLIESGLTVSIGFILAGLFVISSPPENPGKQNSGGTTTP